VTHASDDEGFFIANNGRNSGSLVSSYFWAIKWDTG